MRSVFRISMLVFFSQFLLVQTEWQRVHFFEADFIDDSNIFHINLKWIWFFENWNANRSSSIIIIFKFVQFIDSIFLISCVYCVLVIKQRDTLICNKLSLSNESKWLLHKNKIKSQTSWHLNTFPTYNALRMNYL